jgi:single-strand DNA-binding protein
MSKGTVNKVILIGRLGRDPEMRYAASGTAVVNFTMATNHATKDQDGNFVNQTEWHRVVAYGRTAEVAGEYLAKGKLCFVEGRIQTRQWEDKNGQKRYTTEIICNNMQMLGTKSEGGPDDTSTMIEPPPKEEEPATTDDETASGGSEEDDLPF